MESKMKNCFLQIGLLLWKNLVPWKRIWWKKILFLCLKVSFFLLAFIIAKKIYNDGNRERNSVNNRIFKDIVSPHTESIHLYPDEQAARKILQVFGSNITTYNTEEELIQSMPKGSYNLGVIFTNLNVLESTGEITYKIVLPVNPEVDTAKIYFLDPYTSAGFNLGFFTEELHATQHVINKEIVKQWGTTVSDNYFESKFYVPQPNIAAYTGILTAFPNIIKFGFHVLFICSLIYQIDEMVREKEVKIKDTLSIMGMMSWTNDLSHIIVNLFENFLAIILTVVFLSVIGGENAILPFTSTGLFLFILTYISLYFVVFASALSTIFDSSLKASLTGAVIYLLTIAIKYMGDKYADSPIYLCLLPGVFFPMFIDYLVKLEKTGYGLTFESINKKVWNSNYNKVNSIQDVLLMSLVSFALFIVVIMMNNIGWSYTFRKVKSALCKKDTALDVEGGADTISNKYFEADPKGLNAGIEIKNLSKNFGALTVVNNVSLNIYEGQITVLLGHNGAGKSTTMSMITGLLLPSSGTTYLNGKDIITEIDQARESLGLCPQHNILFNFLTIEEHLWLAAKLKEWPNDIDTEINEILSAVNLTEKRKNLANSLSGGMKRRLSLAMAFVGGSKIVVLDEPTSGLDPDTRRDIWRLLQNERKKRTILMTTHFMDEADALGDRIAIMSAGVIQCLGSPFFLKSVYGAGYHLNLLKSGSNCNDSSVLKAIQTYISQSFIESSTTGELQIILQLDGKASKSAPLLSQLFKHLDQNLSSLGVRSYGLSVTTMEEVFLKVGNLYDSKEKKSLYSQNRPNLSTVPKVSSKFFHQLFGLFMKRCLYFMKHPIFLLMQIIVPSFFFFLMAYFSQKTTSDRASKSIPLSKELYGKSIILYHGSPTEDLTSRFLKQFPDSKHVQLENYPSKSEDWSIIYKYWEDYIRKNFDDGPIGFRKHFRVGLLSENNTIMCTEYIAYTCCVAETHMVNSILPENKKIKTMFHPVPLKDDRSDNSMAEDFDRLFFDVFIGFYLYVCLMILCPTFSYLIITERVSNSKHLQMITGANLGSYWLISILWDYTIYMICVTSIYFICSNLKLSSFTESATGITGFLMLGGLAYIPLVYFLSTLFDAPAKGLSILMMLVLLIGTPAMCMVIFQAGMLKFLFKSFYPTIYPPSVIIRTGFTVEGMSKNISWAISCHSWQAILLLLVLFAKEYNIRWCCCIWTCLCRRAAAKLSINSREDDDVAAERSLINSKSDGELSNFIISMKNVSYFYGKVCPTFCAVNRVCLTVSRGECFGLLGVNGAGKTTTFNMLTGKETVSLGEAFINGKKLSTDYLSIGQQNMGFCPQFDALPLDFNAIEVLTFYARMRGVNSDKINPHVNELIEMLGLAKYARKACGTYSGGNKRKLSLGVAMVGWPDLICLDEPSTGMDPEAKRFMWDALIRYRDAGKTILLTTHSLEECEALCTRLVIMVNGELKCIGSSQHLKNKFGSGYSVQIQLDKTADIDSAENYANLKNQVHGFLSRNFGSVELKDDHHGLLFFHIGKSQNFSLANFFDVLSSNQVGLKIDNYNISQCTLEQVFIDFARSQKESETNRQVQCCTCCSCCYCCRKKNNTGQAQPVRI